MTVDHLNGSARKLLELPTAERIERILAPRWIGYPRAKHILDKMEDLLIYPQSHRMPNMLIVGDTNNGKTMLIDRFSAKHPAIDNPNGDGILAPVIAIQAPPGPDEGRFYNVLLDRIFAPYKPNDRVDKKQLQIIKLLRYVKIKILIIDEIHHLLAGNLNKQKSFLNVIKYLGNELQISIIAAGTVDAFRAIQTDGQLANRFEPELLPRWKLNDDFLRLLVSFERMLPLKNPSHLHDADLSAKIYALTEGYIGELSRFLTKAAVEAVKQGNEKIDLKIINHVDWTPPSKRRYEPERMR